MKKNKDQIFQHITVNCDDYRIALEKDPARIEVSGPNPFDQKVHEL